MVNAMPEIIYYVGASLDGYIATPDGGVEWLSPFNTDDEDYGYSEFYSSIDAALLGSGTYERSLALGCDYSDKPCWVLSQRRIKVMNPDTIVTAQSPRDVVAELEARKLRRVYLVGGGKLAASFRAEALITQYIISIIPVILGSGIPLFASSGPEENLKLVENKSYPNGLIQLRYLRADKVD